MPINETYRRQVALLLRILPFVAAEDCFALKGGTAINLFIRDMPRLSVDIDLMYLRVRSRVDSLAEIDTALKRVEAAVTKSIAGSQVTRTLTEGAVTKLLVRADGVQIKIELSPVTRGTVFEPQLRGVSQAVEDAFGFAEINVVSFSDLYAGKLVAALDRQHPRDLFDVRDLLANEGITDDLREAFVVYMLSHNRPMGEVLSGRTKNLATEYKNGFEGMTEIPIAIEDLIAAQNALIKTVISGMPNRHRQFLIGFERGEPDWSLLNIPHASTLPAILWRQRNLDGLEPDKRARLVARLEEALAGPTDSKT
ncbi:nucleotidyltransferase AbiEii toxin of type IV toxin-antitoxin system [Hoeflea marina]|uniref:Nucleotidyltransferase AbiEii toxin of type IV toxin-antitoxin system n=1 Tax=Hoeflea marina TaxID=274592 RepID=A0A317PU76_9HYPH|nr:nucleotidyl transferase AbiEii/AbiGii toxin family protein [Hoeflea marina]PWW03796.1 nucleotidyltransferase AbiEii toxin of type IV toxin-antitoxin system [Hoeflea marina]